MGRGMYVTSRGRVSIFVFAVLAVLAQVAGCGDGATEPPPQPPPDPPRPTTVTVSPATSQLTALGETVQLTASVRDQNGQAMAGATVTWVSSESAVATVDASGLVTAAGNGTATITASAGTASGTAAVTVMQAPGSVVVEPAEATLTVPGDTVRLAARAFDANGSEVADAQFSWESDDPAVATVDSTGLVTATGNGTAIITASTGSASGSAKITVAAPADSPDRRTLETLYETTLGASWTNATNWLTSAPVGEWHGVEVDASGRVTGLALSRNNLAGRIPPEVGDLDRLRYLHIDHNALTGPLPPELAGATGLTSLRISGNTLFGPLPRAILDLSLREFRYTDTGLCVPPYETFRDWLGGIASHAGTGMECAALTDREILVRLYEATDGPNWDNNTNWLSAAPLNQWHGVATDAGGRVLRLDLSANGLNGVLPPELGGLSNLTDLYLTTVNRGLTGPIPPELGQLRQLQYVDLSHNGLVGSIPPEVGNASSLRFLGLKNNHLTGPIPQELAQLTRLESLYLDLNTLTGELPPALGDLRRLRYLTLHRNLLHGPIPATLLRLDLREFSFEDNLGGLCAPGTTRFVSWLGRMDETSGDYCNAGDAAVLEQLHESAGGTGWTRSDGWLAGQPLSDWYGVVTDSLGYVRELDLSRNGVGGTLPSTLGDLAGLTTLRIGGNALSGPLPLSLTQLDLRELRYADTSLCAPVDGGFQAWLNGVSSHSGTGLECAARDDRAILETLYRSLGGPNWNRNHGWLTDAPLGDWHGVSVDEGGKVVELSLGSNNLSGRIPAELGNLSRLRDLHLDDNAIAGPIPPTIGNLSQLEILYLTFNPLTGEIPPEIGKLSNLRRLDLASTFGLTGSIPAELGRLGKLEELSLNDNLLTGPIPPELGNPSNLRQLILYGNALTGQLPSSLGELSQLENLVLSSNRLSGMIPPTLGNLRNLRRLDLRWNLLSGRIPRELGQLANVEYLALRDNLLTGKIPRELGGLSSVGTLSLGENQLTGVIPARNREPVSPGDTPARTEPVVGIDSGRTGESHGPADTRPDEQSRHAGSPAGRPHGAASTQHAPAHEHRTVRASRGGVPGLARRSGQPAGGPVRRGRGIRRIHDAGCAIGRLPRTARGRQRRLAPGVRASRRDHDRESAGHPRPLLSGRRRNACRQHPRPGRHDPNRVRRRRSRPLGERGDSGQRSCSPDWRWWWRSTPAERWTRPSASPNASPRRDGPRVDVRAMPSFDLTVIPFLAASDPDSSVLEHTGDLNAEADLFRHVRSLLPIGGFTVTVREPVLTQTIELVSVLQETEAIRVMEGRGGYYLGLARRTTGLRGVAVLGRYSASSIPLSDVIAHEIGHNLSLVHAPCGGAEGPDASFPQRDGSTGAWGFDFLNNVLVPPTDPDLMTYCDPRWISGYNFTNMLNHRVARAGEAAASSRRPTKSLLLWGGVDGEGNLFLDPALVVDAPAVLPSSGGAYRLAGLAADGRELFSLNFDMPVLADVERRSSFVYALPVDLSWAGTLERITLSGPEGFTTLDRESDRSVTILLDPVARRVRGILRDTGRAAMLPAAAGLEVLHSRGIPDATAWRR